MHNSGPVECMRPNVLALGVNVWDRPAECIRGVECMRPVECFGAGWECMGPSNRMYQRGWMYGGLRSVMLRYAPHLSSYSQPGWVARVECGNPGADRGSPAGSDTRTLDRWYRDTGRSISNTSVWDTSKWCGTPGERDARGESEG